MKTDNHLDFCLDQTAKSPLHYPDSAFIVRSGKVIGQGYNDYRTGFNGGALKTGLLPLHFPAVQLLQGSRESISSGLRLIWRPLSSL
jgi:hypothetical protein